MREPIKTGMPKGVVKGPYSQMQVEEKLRQTLGLRELVAVGVGGTIGGAIFVLVGNMLDQAGPVGALLAFVLAALVALLIALPYTELACRYPLAGGGYAFVQAILGQHWGFLMGWLYAGSWLFIGSYVALGSGVYFHQVIAGTLAGDVPPLASSLCLIIGLVCVQLMGGKIFGWVQKLLVSLICITLIGGGLISLYYMGTGLRGASLSHFALSLPHGIGGMLAMTPLAFLALAGFDMVATTGEEVNQPQRTLPLAILLTLGSVLLLYLLVTCVTAGVLSGHAHLMTKTPLADVAGQLFGNPGQVLIAIVAVCTTAATANAVLLATSRITFAMARDDLLPSFLARVHPKTGVPVGAIVGNGVILALLTLTNAIGLLATIGSMLYVLQFVFPLVALMIVQRRASTRASPAFRTPTPWLVLPLALGGCVLLIISAVTASGLWGISLEGGWVAAGLVIYSIALLYGNYAGRKRALKKGYTVTLEEIDAKKDQIDQLLRDEQASTAQLRAIHTHINTLKQLRKHQTYIEEYEQNCSARTRIQALKRLRGTQARSEEHELLLALQTCVEQREIVRVNQAHTQELSFLRTLQMQATQAEDT